MKAEDKKKYNLISVIKYIVYKQDGHWVDLSKNPIRIYHYGGNQIITKVVLDDDDFIVLTWFCSLDTNEQEYEYDANDFSYDVLMRIFQRILRYVEPK